MFIEIPASKLSITKRKPVYGVGINDATYITTHSINGEIARCPFYVKWIHMIERCYSNKFQKTNPAYTDCTVCNEWLLFSCFKKWMKHQNWEGKQLDKDLKSKGNKIYSPSFCLFISNDVNSILSKFAAKIKPKGWYFSYNRYVVQCSFSGKQKEYGRFKTKKEAVDRYTAVKAIAVTNIANKQSISTRVLLLRFFNIPV